MGFCSDNKLQVGVCWEGKECSKQRNDTGGGIRGGNGPSMLEDAVKQSGGAGGLQKGQHGRRV